MKNWIRIFGCGKIAHLIYIDPNNEYGATKLSLTPFLLQIP